MKLSKIQKFLKEYNINYELHINKYGNNEIIKKLKDDITKIREGN